MLMVLEWDLIFNMVPLGHGDEESWVDRRTVSRPVLKSTHPFKQPINPLKLWTLLVLDREQHTQVSLLTWHIAGALQKAAEWMAYRWGPCPCGLKNNRKKVNNKQRNTQSHTDYLTGVTQVSCPCLVFGLSEFIVWPQWTYCRCQRLQVWSLDQAGLAFYPENRRPELQTTSHLFSPCSLCHCSFGSEWESVRVSPRLLEPIIGKLGINWWVSCLGIQRTAPRPAPQHSAHTHVPWEASFIFEPLVSDAKVLNFNFFSSTSPDNMKNKPENWPSTGLSQLMMELCLDR